MTEPQEIRAESPSADAEPTEVTTTEVDGRTLRLVGHGDGRSWTLHEVHRPGIAHDVLVASIAMSDHGYFSTDAEGVVRGPYTTLGEATYPLETGDPTLLREHAEPPTPAAGPPPEAAPPVGARAVAAPRAGAAVVALLVVAATAAALRGARRRRDAER